MGFTDSDENLLAYLMAMASAEERDNVYKKMEAMRVFSSMVKGNLLSHCKDQESRTRLSALLEGGSLLSAIIDDNLVEFHQGDIILLEGQEDPAEVLNITGTSMRVAWLSNINKLPSEYLVVLGTGKVLTGGGDDNTFVMTNWIDDEVHQASMVLKNLTRDPDSTMKLILDKRYVHEFGVVSSTSGEHDENSLEGFVSLLQETPDTLRDVLFHRPKGLWKQSQGVLDTLCSQTNTKARSLLERELPQFVPVKSYDGECCWCKLPRTITAKGPGDLGMGSYCFQRYSSYRSVSLCLAEIQNNVYKGLSTDDEDELRIIVQKAEEVACESYRNKKRRSIAWDDEM